MRWPVCCLFVLAMSVQVGCQQQQSVEAGLKGELLRPKGRLVGWSALQWGENKTGYYETLQDQLQPHSRYQKTGDWRDVIRVGGFEYFIIPDFRSGLRAVIFESLPVESDALAGYAAAVLRDFTQVYGEPRGSWMFDLPDGRLNYYDWRFNGTTITLETRVHPGTADAVHFSFQRQAAYQDTLRIKPAAWDAAPLLVREWFGAPVVVVRRSSAMASDIRLNWAEQRARPAGVSYLLLKLGATHPLLAEVQLDQHWRSLNPTIGVYIALDPVTGCDLRYFDRSDRWARGPAFVQTSGLSAGFFSLCGESVYDTAGRPAGDTASQWNLPVPAHYYTAEGDLVVGIALTETSAATQD